MTKAELIELLQRDDVTVFDIAIFERNHRDQYEIVVHAPKGLPYDDGPVRITDGVGTSDAD